LKARLAAVEAESAARKERIDELERRRNLGSNRKQVLVASVPRRPHSSLYHYVTSTMRSCEIDNAVVLHTPRDGDGLATFSPTRTPLTHTGALSLRLRGFSVARIRFVTDGEKIAMVTKLTSAGYVPSPERSDLLCVGTQVARGMCPVHQCTKREVACYQPV